MVYEKLGNIGEARALYKSALRLDPNFTLARNNLNQLEQKIVRSRPSSQENKYTDLYKRGVRFLKNGDYIKAIASFKESTRINPKDAHAHYNLGYGYSELGRHPEAIISFSEAIQIKLNYADAYLGLGYTYEKIK